MIFTKRSRSLPRFHFFFFFNRDYKNIILYKYLQCKDIETNCRNKLKYVVNGLKVDVNFKLKQT